MNIFSSSRWAYRIRARN